MRLISVVTADVTSPDITYNFTEVGIWAVVECNIAIISGKLYFSSLGQGQPIQHASTKGRMISGVMKANR